MKFLLLQLLLMVVFTVNAQQKYSFTAYGGWQHLLAQRGPRGETVMSPVKFAKPIARMFGFGFDMDLKNKWSVGLDLLYGELDWGYVAYDSRFREQSVGIFSGQLGNPGRTELFMGGIKAGYSLFETRKWKGSVFAIPTIAFYPFDKMSADTLNGNSFDRDLDSTYSNPTLYINYPPYQNQGFYFLMRLGYETELKLGKHLGLTGRVSYQQGFQTFLIGYTNIQRLRDPSGPIQELYYTKVNGTAVQWHFGLRYNFK